MSASTDELTTRPQSLRPSSVTRSDAPAERIYKWPATIAVMLGMMTTIMASTMANVAIADIMGAYGVGQDRAHWISSGFLSATTVFMLLNAWCVKNFGARRTLSIACAIFTAASFLGQLSPTYGGIVMARIAQGACAGIIQPLALSVIYSVFPARERGKAMGMFGVGRMLGPALGPIYGGFIIDTIGWRYVFTGSLPFMFLGALMGLRYLPQRTVGSANQQLNWLSLTLVSLSIATFLNGISLGPRLGWHSLTVVFLLFSAGLTMIAFVEVENRTNNPLLNVRLFTIRSFTVVSLIGFVFGIGMFASFYLMPLYLRTVQGFTGTKTGGLLLLSELVTFLIFPIAGWLIQRVNPVYPVAFGMALFSASSLALTKIDVNSGFWFLIACISIGRVGLGLAITALNAAALQGLDRDLVAYGAGTMNFIRMLGGAIGVNLIAIVLEARATYYADHFTATQTSLNGSTGGVIESVLNVLSVGGVSSTERLPYAMTYLGQMITAKANVLAFQDAYLVLAVAFFVATLLALTMAKIGR